MALKYRIVQSDAWPFHTSIWLGEDQPVVEILGYQDLKFQSLSDYKAHPENVKALKRAEIIVAALNAT